MAGPTHDVGPLRDEAGRECQKMHTVSTRELSGIFHPEHTHGKSLLRRPTCVSASSGQVCVTTTQTRTCHL